MTDYGGSQPRVSCSETLNDMTRTAIHQPQVGGFHQLQSVKLVQEEINVRCSVDFNDIYDSVVHIKPVLQRMSVCVGFGWYA